MRKENKKVERIKVRNEETQTGRREIDRRKEKRKKGRKEDTTKKKRKKRRKNT